MRLLSNTLKSFATCLYSKAFKKQNKKKLELEDKIEQKRQGLNIGKVGGGHH